MSPALYLALYKQLQTGNKVNQKHKSAYKCHRIKLKIIPIYVIKAQCKTPEGRGFDSGWGEFLNLPNPSGRTSSWGLLSLYQKWVPEALK
jgi:hypothetical protein